MQYNFNPGFSSFLNCRQHSRARIRIQNDDVYILRDKRIHIRNSFRDIASSRNVLDLPYLWVGQSLEDILHLSDFTPYVFTESVCISNRDISTCSRFTLICFVTFQCFLTQLFRKWLCHSLKGVPQDWRVDNLTDLPNHQICCGVS
ncbi:hypothetical protein D3C84_405290 [compost metagenome]